MVGQLIKPNGSKESFIFRTKFFLIFPQDSKHIIESIHEFLCSYKVHDLFFKEGVWSQSHSINDIYKCSFELWTSMLSSLFKSSLRLKKGASSNSWWTLTTTDGIFFNLLASAWWLHGNLWFYTSGHFRGFYSVENW